MTNHKELIALAASVRALVSYDPDGSISTIEWNGEVYGGGAILSLICFAEAARSFLAAKALYDAYTAADIEHLFRGAPAPIGSDYNYSNGWIRLNGKSYSSDLWYPNNQPVMD